jgi:hypothetical protein
VAPPRGPIAQNQFNPGSVAFDLDAFDELIAAHGVELVHWRAMPNPAGLVDRFDSRRPGEDHVAASNGMVYTHGRLLRRRPARQLEGAARRHRRHPRRLRPPS